jgi:hypothetical protein
MHKRFWKFSALVFAVALPVALFFVAREAASWKPQALAGVSYKQDFAVSPDGRRIAYAPRQTRVIVRELESGASHEIRDQKAMILGVQFAPDGKLLALCWRTSNPRYEQVLEAMLWSQSGSRALEKAPAIDEEGLESFSFAPDGRKLRMLTSSRFLEWDVRSGQLLRVVKMEKAGNALSADAKTIFWGGWGGDVGATDVRTGQVSAQWNSGQSAFEAFNLSPFGSYLLTDKPNSWRVYDMVHRRALWSFPRANITEQNWLFSPDERFLFIAAKSTVEVREMPSGRVVRRLPRVPETELLAVSADGTTLFTRKKSVVYRQRAH